MPEYKQRIQAKINGLVQRREAVLARARGGG